MRPRKDRGGVPGSEDRDVDHAGVEKRFIADAGFGADCSGSFAGIWLEVLCVEPRCGNGAVDVLVAAEIRE